MKTTLVSSPGWTLKRVGARLFSPLVLVASVLGCQTRDFNRPSKAESIELRGKAGKVDRLYLATLHSEETIGTGGEMRGDTLVYGVACYGEPADPARTTLVHARPPLAAVEGNTIAVDAPEQREMALNARTKVHEFNPVNAFDLEGRRATRPRPSTVREARKKLTGDALRLQEGCRIVFGSEKATFDKRRKLDAQDLDLLEAQMTEKVVNTAATCSGSALGSLALGGFFVAGAAAAAPWLVPAALSASGVLGTINGAAFCYTSFRSYLRDITKTRVTWAEDLFGAHWDAAVLHAQRELEGDAALKERFDAAVKEGDLVLASAIFNPIFVRAFNKGVDTKASDGKFLYFIEKTRADVFFNWLDQLEFETGAASVQGRTAP